MQASQRLAFRNNAWNTSLLSLTVATAIASIGLLVDDQMYGRPGPALFVCLAVLSLVMSLAVTSLHYGARSRDLFNNYRRIQRFSTEVEHLRTSNATPGFQEVKVLLERYNDLLDDSENHTIADYKASNPSSDNPIKYSWAVYKDGGISAIPFITLIIPLVVTVPFGTWICDAL